MKRSPKLALLAAVVAVALVASAAFAAVSATSNSGTSSSSAPSAAAGPNGDPPSGAQGGMPSGGRDQFAAALASKLGVSQAKVEAALQSVHQQLGSAQGPPSQDALTAALAKALGVDESKVESALQSVRPPGPPPGAQVPQQGQAPQGQAAAGAGASAAGPIVLASWRGGSCGTGPHTHAGVQAVGPRERRRGPAETPFRVLRS